MTSAEPLAPRALLDTSVLIARESGRPLDLSALPPTAAISVLTLAELRAGVLGTDDPEQRDRRLITYTDALGLDPLPIDLDVAHAWASLRVQLLRQGRRMKANDSWIAATAMAHGIPLVTQDSDFIEGLGVDIIRI